MKATKKQKIKIENLVKNRKIKESIIYAQSKGISAKEYGKIAGKYCTMLVSLLMLLSSCNVTRIVTTEATHFQKGDTTTTIVTKTTETYEGTKK